ncbi:oligosaccharide flippase family protein [Vibrio fluvialis]|nr:oligosaccharide flippase family protein [Vibrio fluvialis]
MTGEEKIHEGGHLRKYLTKAPWYLISSISTKLMGFILLPIYTSHFSQEEIGSLSVYESLGRIIVVAISLYLDAAFTRYYYKVKAESPEVISKFFSTHFWFVLFWGGLSCFSLNAVLEPGTLSLPDASDFVIPALLISQLLGQLIVMLTTLWAANLYVKRLAAFNVLFSLVTILVTLYLIVVTKNGWEYRLYALSLTSLIQFFVVLIIVIRERLLVFSFDFKIIKRSLRYSIPLIPNVLAGWISMFSDRIILSHYGHLGDVGIYSIAAQLSLVLYIVNDAITKIQGPLAMSGMTDNISQAKNKMVDFVYAYLSILILIYTLSASIIPVVVDMFFGEQYKEVVNIFLILGWIYIISGIYRVFTNIVSFHNATWIISSGAIVQVMINVISNVIFIPYYGMYAAAVSSLLSILAYAFWIAYFSQKMERLDLSIFKITAIVTVGISLIVIFSFLDNHYDSLYRAALIKIVLLASLLILIYQSKKSGFI